MKKDTFVMMALGFLITMTITIYVTTIIPPEPLPTFNAAHASACRTLHRLALTKRQTAMAVLACEHKNPDRWQGNLNLSTAGK